VTISNVLASRYASEEMVKVWNAENKIILERELWLAVLQAQKDLGQQVPDGVIDDYRKVLDQVDLDSIHDRERIVKHDVKARIEEFCSLAGHEHIHKGMTSRDLTENVEQLQIRQALELICCQAAAALRLLSENATTYSETVVAGRTHNVAAQVTTLGKRFASAAEEMLHAFTNIEQIIANYPLRGIKGPVGTQQDLVDLLGGSEQVELLEEKVRDHLGFTYTFDSVGQVYPRSLDFSVVSGLVQLSSAPANLAKTLRLMAGHDLVTEGFQEGQVGSSAMPHKMNMRSCERISGLSHVLQGYLTMVTSLVGDQWNEGDVSCSVVRRVALPDAFLAIDGLLQTFLSVLEDFGAYPKVLERELNHYLPFLSTTRILTAATQAGMGREEAHEAIKTHAVSAALDLRNNNEGENTLLQRIADDPEIPLNFDELKSAIATSDIGRTDQQIEAVNQVVQQVIERHPESKSYTPQTII
jgi:adenylosuccinate lyase|tara:strand:+ start:1382 stop:2794 length:1413 start_codon:yes stop_codon:yes gene_type:complete